MKEKSMPNRDLPDPLFGRINITEVAPIIDNPWFQKLNWVLQLGGLKVVFSSANHTRFTHSLGVYEIVRRRVSWLKKKRMINKSQALAVKIAALLHDIGHRPYSHLVEPLVGDHEQFGIELVRREFASTIESLNVNPDLVLQILQKKIDLSDLIFPTPLGADKLDYLVRDRYHAIGGIANYSDFYHIHVGWLPGKGIFLYCRGLTPFLNLMDDYWSLYTDLYERISGRVAQRYLQELIRQALIVNPRLRSIMDRCGEDELIGRIASWSEDNPDNECSQRFKINHRRNHPRKTFIFAERPDLMSARPKRGHISIECCEGLISRSRTWSIDKVYETEKQLSQALDIAPWLLSVSIPPSERRWRVPDILFETASGDYRLLHDINPDWHLTAKRYADIGTSLVVSFTPELREQYVDDPGVQRIVHNLLMTHATS